MSMAKHMVRVAVLVGMVAGGVAQAYVLEDGEMLRGSQDRSGGGNRGPGSLNSGPGSINSGSGREDNHRRRGGDDVRVAQVGDGRQ